MGNRYSHLCRPQRRRRETPFAAQVIAAAGIFGVAVYSAAPQLQQSVTGSSAMIDRIAETERSVYYPNCRAARAAGGAPIHSGSPGYRAELDGDSDGIACEPVRY
jgi:hypothetical protein